MENTGQEAPARYALALGHLVVLVSILFLIISISSIYFASDRIKQKALHDLARGDARHVSQMVFFQLYSTMRDGGTKDDIDEVISGLNKLDPEMRIHVFRGKPVIEQHGEDEQRAAMVRADSALQETLRTGKEYLSVDEQQIRYIFPLIVEDKCTRCHETARAGDTNGIIDVVYPVRQLKVPLEYVTNVVIGYFLLVLLILFVFLYFQLSTMIVRPIMGLLNIIHEVISTADLSRRADNSSSVKELRTLTTFFNRMLQSLQDFNAKLVDATTRDPVTGLFNLNKFQLFVDFQLSEAKNTGASFSLIMLGIDNFRNVNDAYGHPAGDLALKTIAHTIQQHIGSSGIVARVGGDEFAVLMPRQAKDEATEQAGSLLEAVSNQQVDILGSAKRFTASLGVVTYPEDGAQTELLLAAMDLALNKAKQSGRNRIANVNGMDRDAILEVHDKENLIRQALDEDRMKPRFEPIIDLATGETLGYEVLARIHTDDDVIPAAHFIAEAEQLGLVQAIDIRMLEQVVDLKQANALKKARIFLNFSPRTLSDEQYMRNFPVEIKDNNLDCSEFICEITEREALPMIGDIRNLIDDLRAENLGFALDDFGSGFSSFAYLKYLNVQYVKIEGSFVRNIASDERDLAMVRHINELAHEFGFYTIAEFVETPEVVEKLKTLGVDYAQGYYYRQAMDPEDLVN